MLFVSIQLSWNLSEEEIKLSFFGQQMWQGLDTLYVLPQIKDFIKFK
jgi:hypothetical protein